MQEVKMIQTNYKTLGGSEMWKDMSFCSHTDCATTVSSSALVKIKSNNQAQSTLLSIQKMLKNINFSGRKNAIAAKN